MDGCIFIKNRMFVKKITKRIKPFAKGDGNLIRITPRFHDQVMG